MASMKVFKTWFVKKQPLLMLGIGLAGMVTTTILAVKGHVKARDKMNYDPECTNDKNIWIDKKGVRHTKKRYWIKKTWKCYIPAAVTGSLSIACLIGSYSINHRRNAALASSLAVSEAAMTEYQKHVIDTIGEEAEKGVREKFQASQIEKESPSPKLIPSADPSGYMDGDRGVNCYESSTQQHFWASKEDIRMAVNNLNQERLTGFGGEITLNDFYNELGIAATSTGDVLGWKMENPVEVDISTTEVKGIPCLYVTPIHWVSLI